MTTQRVSEPARSAIPIRPRVGDVFNPHRGICGFYPPEIVGRQRGLTDGAKRLYEYAVRWAGRNGRFWYGFERMAELLGKSSRQVKRDMDALRQFGLIDRERRGKQTTNVYRFLYHRIFEGEVPCTPLHGRGEVTDLPSDVTSMSLSEVTSTSPELYKLNYIRESSSSSENAAGSESRWSEKTGSDDDERPPDSFDENQREGTDALILPGFEWRDADPLFGNDPIPENFLAFAQRCLHAARSGVYSENR